MYVWVSNHVTFNTNQVNFIFDGYTKARESLYTLVIMWVNSTIVYYVGTRAMFPRYN